MRAKIRKNTRFITIAVALIIALIAVAVGLILNNRPAEAATGGTITIHIYDPQKNYQSNVYAWVWTDGSDGQQCKISSTAASGEQFKFSSGSYSNTAYTIKYTASAAAITRLNSGAAKLGIIAGVLKSTSGKFWDNFDKDIDEDAYVNMQGAFGSGSNADVYYIRRDTVGYTNIQEAKQALNSVIGVRFSDVTSSGVKVVFSAARPLKGVAVDLYKNGAKVDTASAQQNGDDVCACVVTFSKLTLNNFDYSANYEVRMTIDGTATAKSVLSSTLLDTAGFIKTFETADTQNQEYGALYAKSGTTFRVWAPLAASVKLRIYDKGEGGNLVGAYDMAKRNPSSWGGVWEYTLSGDQKGKYYTYVVNNYGKDTETIDPYAKACGANGKRGMVVDLDSADTNPVGWESDKHLYATNAAAADNPIVWEVSVNDFSSSSDSGMKYKGKYLAFTETGTTVPGTKLKTGVDYLNDLGITYVHLNPVYDFATVDEGDMTRADSGEFNWGYDPQNYNIPEGSFSTDPANGAVRINEFKQMVMALHKAGIGVVMDVVYNHTYATSGQALHDTVPYYYHRTNEDGRLTNDSGCGNGTASERSMVRKYIVESVLYWANEYHIDGFRFDLMGIHDVTTINTVRSALNALDGGKGKALLIYGEPWSADGSYKAASFTNRIEATQSTIAGTGKYTSNANNDMIKYKYFSAGGGDETALNALDPRVAVFNDSGRNGLRGECKDRTPMSGWVNGAPGDIAKVRRMLEGGVGGYAEGLFTGLGSRNVAYAAAHDNYTLWDQIRGAKHGNESALFYDYADPDAIKKCQIVGATYLMSPGIAFMLAGEEMGRTKYGNENSYNSPTKLNTITWSRQAQFSDLYDFYKSVIRLRRDNTNTLFSYTKAAASQDYSYGNFTVGPDYTTGAFTFTRTKGATLTLTLNPSTITGSVKIGTKTVTVKANG